MKVVILCGGQGTRIRDVAADIPKPMIPVGGYPILGHIMKYYARAGFKDFVLCLGHQGNKIRQFFLDYRTQVSDFTIDFANNGDVTFHNYHEDLDWKVTLVETGLNTLTGSRVKKIESYIGDDENFMMTYGDGVGDIDLKKLEAFHYEHGRVMTVSGVRPPGRFGEIGHDQSGMVTEFNEKPQATGGRISGGFFVCKRELFTYLDAARDDETLETEPMQRMANEKQMMICGHDGFWQCMDTNRDYLLLNDLVASGNAPWMVG